MGEHWRNTVRRARHFSRSLLFAFTFGCVMTALVLVTSGDRTSALYVLAAPPVAVASIVYWRVRRARAEE